MAAVGGWWHNGDDVMWEESEALVQAVGRKWEKALKWNRKGIETVSCEGEGLQVGFFNFLFLLAVMFLLGVCKGEVEVLCPPKNFSAV